MIKEKKDTLTNKNGTWNISKELISDTVSPINSVINYSPFYESDHAFILDISLSEDTAYVTLRNGVVLKIVNDKDQDLKTNEELMKLNKIPNSIKISTRIIDLVCGKEHCLAKGRNNLVYSWGKNTYGQLGLGKSVIEAEEPEEIGKLSKLDIKQIYAYDYNSIAVDQNNNVYGFGKVIYIYNIRMI